jgi:hypothetical protein
LIFAGCVSENPKIYANIPRTIKEEDSNTLCYLYEFIHPRKYKEYLEIMKLFREYDKARFKVVDTLNSIIPKLESLLFGTEIERGTKKKKFAFSSEEGNYWMMNE